MKTAGEILAGFETLPLANIATILAGRRPLILAPHPDDESLGCGGLIAAACAGGLAPVIAMLTDGAASHPGSRSFPPARLAALRESEARDAVAHLGLPEENLVFLREPDTKLAPHGPIIERLMDIVAEQHCQLIIAPWSGDPHCDHEAGAAIAEALAIRTGLPRLSYPVWGWLRDHGALLAESRPTGWRLDISQYLARKSQAIAAHASQYGDVIMDCPNGFKLPQNLLAIFARPFEVFLSE
jgi:LmbE family N-acetylglucosaminyl deacetylase